MMLAFSMATADFLLLVVIVAAASYSFTGVHAGAACAPKERDALLAFRQGITSDPWGLLASWQPEDEHDCCQWEGVQCSNLTGHVLELHLSSGHLTGGGLTGEISRSLLSLQHLEYVDASLNNLQGPTGQVPEFLGSFKNLRYLDLSYIPFSGRVPPQLGNLSKLHYLDLSNAGSQQHMYSTDLSWLTHLPLLQYLNMESVNLSMVTNWPYVVNMLPSLRVLILDDCSLTSANQSLPHLNLTNLEELHLSSNSFQHPVASCWFWNLTSVVHLSLVGTELYGQLPSTLGDMVSLQILDLSLNNITGPLPAFIGHFAHLRTLDLSDNHLTGHVPSEIGMLANLTKLDLSGNDLDGSITEEHLDGLRSLEYIDLSKNQLKIVVGSKWQPTFRLQKAYFASCQVGPLFPAWLKWQVDILQLDISNTGIIDRLPDWFCNTFSKAEYLEISNNQISDGLPTNMDIMSLNALYFSSNNLTGQIPPLPRNLFVLDISRNSLSGPLPSNFGAPMLDMIILYSNYISGQIPTSICELSLQILNLANNLFEGELPQCLNMSNMVYLLLSNNSFSGNFPSFLRSCTSLRFLDLSWNRFSGSLPKWIGSFSSLQFLRLNHNMFYGHIPNNITSLTNLYHLNLAANWISGVIPPHLSNLTYMTRIFIMDPAEVQNGIGEFLIFNEFLIDTKGNQLNYQGFGVLEVLSIDLSSNHLTGKIPDGITSLDGLVNLNLSWNQLNGEVPDKIGTMQSLESLDLSNNNLFGEIPSSISNLTFLSILDLSYNNLTGRIPSGRQLDTLYMENPSMYDGNNGLCGRPLQRNCGSNNTSEHGDEKRDEHHSGPMFFYFGLGIGYVVGLWVVFCALLFLKVWRIAYFHLVDRFYDKIYVFVVVTWKSFTRKDDVR
ncbi:receptor-like protein EIX1 [Phragmites australis]|uniref:receptor-like protein EIX1 n=1 Tax=Phragmites australis TaxID=29695 RepID=UPI002D7869A0|nr:receptor-like protein EIX1 [Phragmites australis]